MRAEELGFHSVWFSDHVVTERVTGEGEHPANLSGKRAYPDRPVLLDIPTTIGAIASRTTTLRFSPSVYIAPYRHPLITAHEFATLDVLSGGRVILGVGVGWEKGEFAAMGSAFEHRGAITDECIQIYKLAWTEPWIDFHGKFFDIENVSMDPKPVQKPHPPIWYGGVTPIAAKRAARRCDGFYPMYLDAVTRPETFDHLREEIAREAERIGRDLTGFKLGGFCQMRLDDDAANDPRFAFSEQRPAVRRLRGADPRGPRALRELRLQPRHRAPRLPVGDRVGVARAAGALRRGGPPRGEEDPAHREALGRSAAKRSARRS